jgi:hypothetical protein
MALPPRPLPTTMALCPRPLPTTIALRPRPPAATATMLPLPPSADATDHDDATVPASNLSSASARFGVASLPRPSFDPASSAQIDTGASVSCTHLRHLLHRYCPYTLRHPSPVRLLPAVDHPTLPLGEGFLHVPSSAADGYTPIRTFFSSPSLTATLLSDISVSASLQDPTAYHKCTLVKIYDTHRCSIVCSHCTSSSLDLVVPGFVAPNGKCFSTLPLLLPRHPATSPAPVLALSARTDRLLWHQRLGHPSDHYLYNAHRYIDGVPKFAHHDPVLDLCPTCIRAKQTKSPAGPHSTRTATVPFQGLSIDFSFTGTASADASRADLYQGLNGETSWILISDHFTRHLYGDARCSKASPLHWLDHFLRHHAPPCPHKYVYMDQGGELYRNPKLTALFQRYGYAV